METLVISPAYGRDYKSKKACLEDWNNNKDFIIQSMEHSGRYISKRDEHQLILARYTQIEFRYSKLTKVFLLELL